MIESKKKQVKSETLEVASAKKGEGAIKLRHLRYLS
jgi:hypothetical protein